MPYKKGAMTVMCNATRGILNTAIPDPIRGRGGISLDKGGYIDIEKVLSQAKIRRFLPELERMEQDNLIRWAEKGSKPDNKFLPRKKMRLPKVGQATAPINDFDKQLDAVIEKEKIEDEKTKAGAYDRSRVEAAEHRDAAADRSNEHLARLEDKNAELERELEELRKEREETVKVGKESKNSADKSEEDKADSEEDEDLKSVAELVGEG